MPYLDVLGRRVRVSNLEKVFWPQTGATKGEALDYYIGVSPLLLPCLKGRLVSLFRVPDGVGGPGFFQKNCPVGAPSWVKTFPQQETAKSGSVNYVLVEDLPTLVWLVNMGVVEFHPWLSSIASLDCPDYAVFDLDPAQPEDIEQVRLVALAIAELLQELSLVSMVKTSGATGLQIFIPLEPIYPFRVVRDFVQACCQIICRGHPRATTMERHIAKRQGRVYLDFLQNAKGKTMVSAYSLRAQPIPCFSFPLRWGDLGDAIDPRTFSLPASQTTKISPLWMEKTPKQRLNRAAQKVKIML